MNLNQTIGENIQRLRHEKGVSQSDVAASLEISGHQHVSNWECGVYAPSAPQLVKLAHYFGVSIDELFKGAI